MSALVVVWGWLANRSHPFPWVVMLFTMGFTAAPMLVLALLGNTQFSTVAEFMFKVYGVGWQAPS